VPPYFDTIDIEEERMGRIARTALRIAPEETSFTRRRFRCDSAAVRERLEEVGRTFVRGYHAALDDAEPQPLAASLAGVAPELRGFAYEGAAMGLTLLDALTPWRRDRLARFLAGPGDAHAYIVHVGAGWALARLPLSPRRLLARLDPVLGWLAFDGYGFHQGFFHWPRAVSAQEVPARLGGYARRAFDQGLGRSLWFVEGADGRRIPATIAAFPAARRGDLWSGVGLACAYAGGMERLAVVELRRAAGEHAPRMAQGAAFAAKARVRAGNPVPHTRLACEVLCGTGDAEAAAAADAALPGATDGPPPGGLREPAEPAFEVWRQRLQDRFSPGGAIA